MPIYEYVCKDCNTKFEAMRSFSQADAPIACAKCGSENTKRAISMCYAQGDGLASSGHGSGCSCGSCSGNCSHCH